MDEAFFLQGIDAAPGDGALRTAYADWLEERGDRRAQLVRTVEEMRELPVCSGAWRRGYDLRRRLSEGCEAKWLSIVLRPTPADIRRRIEEMAGLATGEGHASWQLNAQASLAEVEQAERLLLITLPEQYRQFLLECGDGGMGPGGNWASEIGVLPRLSRIVPFSEPDQIQIPFSPPARSTGLERRVPPGCLWLIGHNETRVYLVVTGKHRGEVWGDCRIFVAPAEWGFPAFGAIDPARPKQPVQFLDWYASWLDGQLWQASNAWTPAEELFELSPDTELVALERRRLTELPASLRRLTRLKSLYLGAAGLAELPEWLGDFTELEQLTVGMDSQLRRLPRSLGRLRNLKRLTCSHSERVQELPEELGELGSLEKLLVNGNRLQALPESLGGLERLERLDLGYNQLRSLPESIGRLRRLRKLSLMRNRLESLPSLEGMNDLEELDLSENDLRTLPESLGRLPSLVRLNLRENPQLDLAQACRVLAQAPQLKHLDVPRLVPEIGLLVRLEQLRLPGYLEELPDEISALTNLKQLDAVMGSTMRRRFNQLLPHLADEVHAEWHEAWAAQAEYERQSWAQPRRVRPWKALMLSAALIVAWLLGMLAMGWR